MLKALLILAILLLPACREESQFSQKGRALIAAENWPAALEHYLDTDAAQNHQVATNHGRTLAELYLAQEPVKAENITPPSADGADNALFYYDVGNYFLSRGQAKEAITFYKKSLILKPAFTLAAQNLQLALLLNSREAGGRGAESREQMPKAGNDENISRAPREAPQGPQNQKENHEDQKESAEQKLPIKPSRPGGLAGQSLKERLELLLGRENVLILTPSAHERRQGSTLYPNW